MAGNSKGRFATGIPGAISKVESAAGIIATTVPTTLEAILPKTCSLGTGQFCVGTAKNVTCSNLPLNLTQIIPLSFENLVPDSTDGFNALHTVLENISIPYIPRCLVLGLFLILVHVIVINCSLYGLVSFPTIGPLRFQYLRRAILLALRLLCCIPFFVSVNVLDILRTNSSQLPSWIYVQYGGVYGICLGCLSCAVGLATLGSVL